MNYVSATYTRFFIKFGVWTFSAEQAKVQRALGHSRTSSQKNLEHERRTGKRWCENVYVYVVRQLRKPNMKPSRRLSTPGRGSPNRADPAQLHLFCVSNQIRAGGFWLSQRLDEITRAIGRSKISVPSRYWLRMSEFQLAIAAAWREHGGLGGASACKQLTLWQDLAVLQPACRWLSRSSFWRKKKIFFF